MIAYLVMLDAGSALVQANAKLAKILLWAQSQVNVVTDVVLIASNAKMRFVVNVQRGLLGLDYLVYKIVLPGHFLWMEDVFAKSVSSTKTNA